RPLDGLGPRLPRRRRTRLAQPVPLDPARAAREGDRARDCRRLPEQAGSAGRARGARTDPGADPGARRHGRRAVDARAPGRLAAPAHSHPDPRNAAAQPMRIAGVTVWKVDASWRNWVFLRVETDSDLVGWGECTVE